MSLQYLEMIKDWRRANQWLLQTKSRPNFKDLFARRRCQHLKMDVGQVPVRVYNIDYDNNWWSLCVNLIFKVLS